LRCGLVPVFYDVDERDLNADLSSIDFLAKRFNCSSLLVASMYGNPADLPHIEEYCKCRGIMLIDDAAQSFGAKVDGRCVGSYGNAGFFSFSPGKPTAGHLGAFFWTENDSCHIQRSHHHLYHYSTYLDFYFNRLHCYRYRGSKIGSLFSLLRRILSKSTDITNDEISKFEVKILGGILSAHMKGGFDFRRRWADEFVSRFDGNPSFRTLKALRGKPHNHKLVAVFNDSSIASLFIKYMKQKRVYTLNGYIPLTDDYTYLPNLEKLSGSVVEMPIEDNEMKMNYLFDTLTEFVDQQ